jgi:lysozyme family protein
MKNFDAAFQIIVGEEGKYSNDPRDRGNWTGGAQGVGELRGTKYGIAAHAYPHLDIVNLTHEQAKEIYRADYWNAVRGDEIPWPLSLYLFDCAVNQGVGAAGRMLQEALNGAGDGAFGPVTIRAARRATPRMAARFLAIRARRYIGTRNFDIYGTGWLTRLFVMAREGGCMEV